VIDWLVRKTTDWLISKNVVAADDKDIYEYAMYCTLISYIPILYIVVVSALFGWFGKFIFFWIPFVLIRKFSGGYHANSTEKCLLFSCTLLTICLIIVKNLYYSHFILLIGVIAAIGICVLSPVESVNKPLTKAEKKQYGMITIGIVCFMELLSCVFLHFKDYDVVMCMQLSIIMVFVFVGVESVLNIKKTTISSDSL